MESTRSSSILRSVAAVLVGALAGIVLSVGTDLILHAAGLLPGPGTPPSDAMLAWATAYRTVYGIFGAWLTARLAPSRPWRHVAVLAGLGLLANIAGLVTTWNKAAEFGPHWYPIALTVLALPTSFCGGWLALRGNR